MYTHINNDEILEKWRKRSLESGHGDIELDGVQYKGEINTFIGSNGVVYHERTEGNEEIVWNGASKRILFIAKELNDRNNPYDSRVVVKMDAERGIIPTNRFVLNMLYVTAGLINSTPNFYQSFNFSRSLDEKTLLMKEWDRAAVAKINIKKQPGSNKSIPNEIFASIDQYGDLLIEQLQLLSPTIIVCCGTFNYLTHIFNQIYPSIKTLNNWISFVEKDKMIIINGYHFSAYSISYRSHYEGIVYNYIEALKDLGL